MRRKKQVKPVYNVQPELIKSTTIHGFLLELGFKPVTEGIYRMPNIGRHGVRIAYPMGMSLAQHKAHTICYITPDYADVINCLTSFY